MKDNRQQNVVGFLDERLISLLGLGLTPANIYLGRTNIEIIKQLDENVLVAVRASQSGKLFARSIYVINKEKLARYIESGTTVKVEADD